MKNRKAFYSAILAVLLLGASCKTTNIYLLPSHPPPAIVLPIAPYYPLKHYPKPPNRFSALADSAMKEVLKEYSK